MCLFAVFGMVLQCCTMLQIWVTVDPKPIHKHRAVDDEDSGLVDTLHPVSATNWSKQSELAMKNKQEKKKFRKGLRALMNECVQIL